jgi:LacI family transcriptional regulator
MKKAPHWTKPYPPTMTDIARLAGVHQTTVSLALRNHPSISELTRARIIEIARCVGYRSDPELDAFNFYRQSSHPLRSAPSIAFISDVPSASWASSAARCEVYAGARATAERMGFVFERFHVGPGELSVPRLNGILQSRNVECVILGSLSLSRSELDLDWSRLCGLKIESFHVQPPLDVISSDHNQAGRLAFERLWRLGYRRIGLLLSREEDQRLQNLSRIGYLTERETNRSANRVPVYFQDGRPIAELFSWIRRQKIDALIGNSNSLFDEIGHHPLIAARRIAIASLDLAGSPPDRAGIVLPHAQVGATAVELIEMRRYSHHHGLPQNTSTTFVPVAWRDGLSAPMTRSGIKP